jgi:hypothetical protein
MSKIISVVSFAALAAAVPFVSVSQINAIYTTFPSGTQPGAAPPLVTSATTEITTHGPWSGTPTTVGPEQAPTTISATLSVKPNPTATYYNPNGKLGGPEQIPFLPSGNSECIIFLRNLH